jgi:hypothetical protein
MNKLKTTVEVTCNLQGKAMPTEAIVIGSLGERRIKSDGIKVSFSYETADNEAVLNSDTTYTWNEVNALWEAIKSNVPLDATFEELLDIAFIQAFKIEMAEVFGISRNDIEEVA